MAIEMWRQRRIYPIETGVLAYFQAKIELHLPYRHLRRSDASYGYPGLEQNDGQSEIEEKTKGNHPARHRVM